MSVRITDQELELYGSGEYSVTDRMARDLRAARAKIARTDVELRDLRDLRAQRAASRERVRKVVRKALRDGEMASHLERLDGALDRIAARVADALAAPHPALDAARVRDVVREAAIVELRSDPDAPLPFPIADAIAARAAEQLAGQAVSAGLDDQERAQLVDLLHTDAAHDHPAAEQAIRRMLDGQAVALGETDRDALCSVRHLVVEEAKRHPSQTPYVPMVAALDRLLSTPVDRGQAVALSAEERAGLAYAVRVLEMNLNALASLNDPTAAEFVDSCSKARRAIDRLLSTTGQGASPAAAEVAEPQPGPAENLTWCSSSEHGSACVPPCPAALSDAPDYVSTINDSHGRTVRVMQWDTEVPAQPHPGPDQSAVDPALCRRLAREAADAHARWILIVEFYDRLPEVARQLTAAADLRDAFEEATCKLAVTVTAKENAEHELEDARAECERLRAAIESASNDRFRAEMQCGAAKEECERLRSELNKRPLRTFDQFAADRLADEVAVLVRRKVIDARSPAGNALLDYRDPPPSPRADRLATLEAEFVALRRTLWARLEERQAITSRIYDLLATEPAVSEERCTEIHRLADRPWQVRAPTVMPAIPNLLAAARQLHALRAGLREIVGGETTSAPTRVTLDPRQLLDLQRMRADYEHALGRARQRAANFPGIQDIADGVAEYTRWVALLDHLLAALGPA